MKRVGHKQKKQAYQLLKYQAMAVLVIFLILFAFLGFRLASAALVGGAISVVANLLCLLVMYRGRRYEPNKVLGRFFSGELVKILSTVGMFIISFKMLTFAPLYLLAGYGFAHLSFLLAPLFSQKLRSMNFEHNDAEQAL